jgi:hypothetical protein
MIGVGLIEEPGANVPKESATFAGTGIDTVIRILQTTIEKISHNFGRQM